MKLTVALAIILGLAVVMTMTGRGGGNFYVPVLVACGVPMHQAAATGHIILMSTAPPATLL
jgi:uncharacterized membrane protein YfcA